MGFCRTNLFKRLESSGLAFIQSLERHVLRNCVYIYAIQEGLPVPIGTSDPSMLDSEVFDQDADDTGVTGSIFDAETEELIDTDAPSIRVPMYSETAFAEKAGEIYDLYSSKYKKRFKWLRPGLFMPTFLRTSRPTATPFATSLLPTGRGTHIRTESLRSSSSCSPKATRAKSIGLHTVRRHGELLDQRTQAHGVASKWRE